MSSVERQLLIRKLEREVPKSNGLNRGLPLFRARPTRPNFDRSFDFRFGENLSQWLSRLRHHEKLSGAEHWEPLQRTATTRGFAFYRNEVSGNRRLLVGWSGVAKRLMVPVANYLPALASLGADLLLLWPDRSEGYANGVSGLGTSVKDVAAQILRMTEGAGYASIAVLGTSLGSIPAILSASTLGASRCAVVGLSSPDRDDGLSLWRAVDDEWRDSEIEFRPDLTFTHGGEAHRDELESLNAAKVLGGRILRIPAEGHAPIWGLMKIFGFRSWLSDAVFGEPQC